MTSSVHKLKQTIKGLSILLMRFVINQPKLKEVTLSILFKMPGIKAYLNNIALSGGLSTNEQREVKLTEISKGLGSVIFENTSASKVTDIDYFACQIPQKLCQAYALNFDFDLIEKIRRGQPIDFSSYSGDKLKLGIVHVYLALLYKFPSNNDIKHGSVMVLKHSSFEPLIKTLLKSADYKSRGRKQVIS